ncbi:hypothetical protein [Azospirillum canadense]|uniref:hypothetical protein n=1 Tax=Azospirillum canadense TaxID=403962 RepID=UPI0022266691|nr:hypothetical protein [Azospirillum canadense]MCW2242310.1 hypothetical protein [Azospirillum canadense]
MLSPEDSKPLRATEIEQPEFDGDPPARTASPGDRQDAEAWCRIAVGIIPFAATLSDLVDWWRADVTTEWLVGLKRLHPDLFERVNHAKDEHKAALSARHKREA